MLGFDTFWEKWVSIQSLVLRTCASPSLFGLPVNSGYQFNCGIGADWISCVGGTISCEGGTGSCTGGAEGTTSGTTEDGWGAGGLPFAMSNYIVNHPNSKSNPNPNF